MAEQKTTPLEPELLAAGAGLRERGLAAPPPHTSPLDAARAGYDAVGDHLCGLRPSPRSVHERQVTIDGPDGPIDCHVIGTSRSPAPALVYFHGGGFALGRARDWRAFARDVAQAGDLTVILVDYRLAPEHRFPAGIEDALAVIRHVRRHGGELGVDPERLAAGGDSAGANLALSAAIANAADDPSGLKALLLFYGVFKRDFSPPEWERLGGFGLSRDLMEWIWNTYLGNDFVEDWRATPLDGDLAGLPPIIQVVGDLDPLIDDARVLKSRLDVLSIDNALSIEPGLNHGFIRLGPVSPRVDGIVGEAAGRLARLLT